MSHICLRSKPEDAEAQCRGEFTVTGKEIWQRITGPEVDKQGPKGQRGCNRAQRVWKVLGLRTFRIMVTAVYFYRVDSVVCNPCALKSHFMWAFPEELGEEGNMLSHLGLFFSFFHSKVFSL